MSNPQLPDAVAKLITRCREDNAGNLAYLRQHLGARPLLIGWLHKNAGASARLVPLLAEALGHSGVGDFDPDAGAAQREAPQSFKAPDASRPSDRSIAKAPAAQNLNPHEIYGNRKTATTQTHKPWADFNKDPQRRM